MLKFMIMKYDYVSTMIPKKLGAGCIASTTVLVSRRECSAKDKLKQRKQACILLPATKKMVHDSPPRGRNYKR